MSWRALPPPPPLPGRFVTEAAFDADPRPHRRNLRTGVFVEGDGTVHRLDVVVEAERRLLEQRRSPDYLPLTGDPGFAAVVRGVVGSPAASVVATPGGTAAARLLAGVLPAGARWWLPDPGWPNHPRIVRHGGGAIGTYPCPTTGSGWLDGTAIGEGLAQVAAGDVVLLHAGAHNPSGLDLSVPDWRALGRLLRARGALTVLDVAFLGYRDTPEAELAGPRALLAEAGTAAWTLSFGKTLRLYGERVGALVFEGPEAARALAHARDRARGLWSTPPAHGQWVAAEVLGDPALRARWLDGLAQARHRLAAVRKALAQALRDEGSTASLAVLEEGRGLFAHLPLAPEAVQAIAAEHALYLGPTGGLNLTALWGDGVERLARAAAPWLR